jgi:hypothetical protein
MFLDSGFDWASRHTSQGPSGDFFGRTKHLNSGTGAEAPDPRKSRSRVEDIVARRMNKLTVVAGVVRSA